MAACPYFVSDQACSPSLLTSLCWHVHLSEWCLHVRSLHKQVSPVQGPQDDMTVAVNNVKAKVHQLKKAFPAADRAQLLTLLEVFNGNLQAAREVSASEYPGNAILWLSAHVQP